MNLGRFHSAINAIKTEVERDKNIQLLSELQTKLQNLVNEHTAESGDLFKNSYANFINTLEKAESNFTFPTRRIIYKEIGAAKHIGIGLAEQIKKIISENQITPGNALAAIQIVNQELTTFYEKIKLLNNTFSDLKIEFDGLSPGEFEIGFSFPQEVIGVDLESLEKEFHKLDFALQTLLEITTGKVGKVEIKTISASPDWQLFFDSIPVLAACTAVAIERIVNLYKNNLEIKLDEKKLPVGVTKPLQDHIEQTVISELRKIAEDLVEEFYQVKDEGRKNELKTKASQALQYIAEKIDNGATIEVHAEPPDAPKPEAEAGETGNNINQQTLLEYERIKKIADKVNNSAKLTLEFERSSGPVLFLKHEEYETKSNNPSTEPQ